MVDSSLKTRQLVLSTRSRAGTDVSDVPPSEGVGCHQGVHAGGGGSAGCRGGEMLSWQAGTPRSGRERAGTVADSPCPWAPIRQLGDAARTGEGLFKVEHRF